MVVVADGALSVSVEPRVIHSCKVAYARLMRAIVRPPRAEYDIEALGPKGFAFNGSFFTRDDREVTNLFYS